MMKTKYYDEFIQTNKKLTKKNTNKFKEHVYFLGYFDGIYNEEEYKRYIPDDEECINLYANGYIEGKTDKEKKDNKFVFRKPEWIEKLAVYDFKNHFRDRHLTDEAAELYNLNYDDLTFSGEDTFENANEAASELEEKNIRF